MGIEYVSGDVTLPSRDQNGIVAHVCNDRGLWGAGVSGAISRRWPIVEAHYRQWHRGTICSLFPFKLGSVQYVGIEEEPYELWVANMVAQSGINRPRERMRRIRYDSLTQCFVSVERVARDMDAIVHMPYIGTGLGGGDWSVIEPIIEQYLCYRGVGVRVYAFDKDRQSEGRVR